MECRNCSFQNSPGTSSCLRCQSLLDLSGVDVEPPRGSRNPLVRGAVRAMDVSAIHTRSIADTFRPVLWLHEPLRIPLSEVVAAVIPGFPHVRNSAMGRRGFGWAIVILWSLAMLGCIVVIGEPLSDFLLYLAISIHGTSFAMLFSDRLTASSMLHRIGVGLACFVMVGCLLYAPVVYGAGQFIRPLQLTNVHAIRGLADGDVVLCSGPRLNTGPWNRGELVLVRMDAAPFGNGYFLDSRYNVDRIMGLPGDVIEIRNRVLYVNGEELPLDLGPIGPHRPDFSLTVPSDRYFVPPSALRWTLYGIDARGLVTPMYINAGLIRPENLIGRVVGRIRPWSNLGRIEGAAP